MRLALKRSLAIRRDRSTMHLVMVRSLATPQVTEHSDGGRRTACKHHGVQEHSYRRKRAQKTARMDDKIALPHHACSQSQGVNQHARCSTRECFTISSMTTRPLARSPFEQSRLRQYSHWSRCTREQYRRVSCTPPTASTPSPATPATTTRPWPSQLAPPTTGSNNVYIGAGIVGVAGESNACYIANIFSANRLTPPTTWPCSSTAMGSWAPPSPHGASSATLNQWTMPVKPFWHLSRRPFTTRMTPKVRCSMA